MGITVLIVDDEVNARENITEFLAPLGYDVRGVGTVEEARASLNRADADVVLLDVLLPDGYGTNLLVETRNNPLRPPIILMTAFGDIDMAVEAMKNGASDFLTKPIQLKQLKQSIDRAYEMVAMRRELMHLRRAQEMDKEFVAGKSEQIKMMLSHAQKAAATCVSVLITGETGTGKEVLAKYIWKAGPREKKPFVAINCAAIQPTMLESELFGHEAGAFTSADRRKPGLMETADQGILFLDEISSMSSDMQAKVLRALEDKKIRRVGGQNEISVDIQLIAASNKDLKAMIADNLFRADLYYRLKVVDLSLPPLRERKEDIPELVGFFIRKYNRNMGYNVEDLTPKAMEAMIHYNWPGNIRELSHAIERAMLFSDGQKIDISDLPIDVARMA
jgi:DNA-binding NtrC family response regulator